MIASTMYELIFVGTHINSIDCFLFLLKLLCVEKGNDEERVYALVTGVSYLILVAVAHLNKRGLYGSKVTCASIFEGLHFIFFYLQGFYRRLSEQKRGHMLPII